MRVVLGVSGSIAAYKTPELVRLCRLGGMDVSPVLTRSAMAFVTPLALSTVAETEVVTPDTFFSGAMPHLQLERTSDVLVVAPASANVIAKFAMGIADDALSTVFLAFQGPRLVVPAMHPEMWLNPVVQENVMILKKRGVLFLGPFSGALACGDVGVGRMAEPAVIVSRLLSMAFPELNLSGKRVLVTAGGTSEKIDAMRVLTNRSTGKFGRMLAQLAEFYGADVKLIEADTVSGLQAALKQTIDWATHLYMAAAVSDFTVKPRSEKLRRGSDAVSLELESTEDVLAVLAKHKGNRCFVGFCLADEDLIAVAREKLVRKGVDFIVANGSESVGSERRTVHVLSALDDAVYTASDVSLMEAAYRVLQKTA